MSGQLDVDVERGPQRLCDLVSRAPGRADVDDDPQWIPAGDPGLADQALAEHRAAVNGVERRASLHGRADRPVEQRLTVNPQLAPRGIQRGHEQRARARRAHEPHRPGDGIGVDAPTGGDQQHRRLGEAADDLVRRGEHRVGAELERRARKARWKPKCEPHAPSTMSATPAACATSAHPADIGGHPVVGRRDDERGGRIRARSSALASASGVTPWAIPSSTSYSGATKLGSATAQDQAVDHARVGISLDHHPHPGRGEREAERVVALGRTVGEEPCPLRSVGLRGELLGALVGSRRGPDIDPLDVLGDVEQQRAVAERVRRPGSAPSPPLCPGT